eukprot:4999997-Ditylum_brightwellii.AAC.1
MSKAEMVFFFTDMSLIDVETKVLTELEKEGITEVKNLDEFNKATFKQVAGNLRRPGGWTKNLDNVVEKGNKFS